MGYEFSRKLFALFKNARKEIFMNFPAIFLTLIFLHERIWLHETNSRHTVFQLGMTCRTFIPPFCNHSKIMEIFFEVLGCHPSQVTATL